MCRKLTNLVTCVSCLIFITMSIARADLVAWWRFEEGSGAVVKSEVDSPATDATIVGGGSVTWADTSLASGANTSYALEFTGATGDFVQANSYTGIGGNNPRSVTAWIKTSEVSSNDTIVSWGANSTGNRFTVRENAGWGGGQLLALRCEVQGGFITGTMEVSDGQWHHVGVVFDGGGTSDVKLYVDGKLDTPSNIGDITLDTDNITNTVAIGGWPNGERVMIGLIDDVRIYDHALSDVEVGFAMTGEPNPYAYSPEPADDIILEATWATLNWSPGDLADSHDVYLGDNFDDVNNGTRNSEVYRSNHATTFYIAGIPGFAYPDGFVPGTTYYWRIDEVRDTHPDSPWKGNIWSFSVPPKTAWKPNPADGAKFVDPDVTLNWTQGWGGLMHTIYFSDDYETVKNATGGTPQIQKSYDPGPLELGKTYYWRVDEFDSADTHTGNVWSFTITTPTGGLKGVYYSNRDLVGEPVLVRTDPGINFDWGVDSPDPNTVSANEFSVRWIGELEVAFSEPYTFYPHVDNGVRLWINDQQLVDGWENPAVFEYKSVGIDLIGSKRYPIMMEYHERDGTALAQLSWESPSTEKQIIPQAAFSPPMRASSPKPPNGAIDVKTNPILTWITGDYVDSHEVFLGIDENVVKNADTTSPEYKGTKILGDENCDPGKLTWATTYYWRIDEVNSVHSDSPWVGNIWSFTTGDFLVVDDFEDYDADENQIWYSWHDGLGYGSPGTEDYSAGNGTGSAVGDETTLSYTEEAIVNGGNQSMPLSYDNNKQGFAKYSEVELTLSYPRDWTEEGVSELSIWFRGRPGSVGSFVEDPVGTYTMTASGADIWNMVDEFHFAYKILTGPGSIIARVESVQNTHDWAKAGVMIRETLEAGSKHAFACITSGNGVASQGRTATDGTSFDTNETGITAPHWVKLERDAAGNFTVSHSANGTTWQSVASALPMNIPMTSNVYVGLALTSHVAALTCQVVFSNVTTTGSVSPQWANQDIGIESNSADPLYVAVSNSNGTPAVVVHDDPAAAQIDTWTEWVIPLQTLTDQGIILTDVDRIFIGLGTQGNMTIPGGSGKMYIDDIRLYQPREAAE